MVNTELLEEFINASGLKKSYLADKLHMTTQSFTRKVRNESLFTNKDTMILCEELGIKKLSDKERVFFYEPK